MKTKIGNLTTPYGPASIEVVGTYMDKTPAIELIGEDGSQICRLTVCVGHLGKEKLGSNEILVKSWSENEKIAALCLATGLFKDTGRRIPTGLVEAQIWEVL